MGGDPAEDTTTLYDADGNVTATTDPSGRITATTYDDDAEDVADYAGQVITTSDPQYSSSTKTWTFSNLSPSNVAPGSVLSYEHLRLLDGRSG